jgi:hypothetical protein
MEAPEPSEDLDFASIYAAAAREIVRGSPALVHSSYRRVDPLGYRTHGELLDLGPKMDDSTKEAIEAALPGTDIRLRPNWNPVNWCNPKWASAVVSSFSWPRVIDSETVEITGEWEDRGGRGPVVLTLAQSGDEWTIIDIATGDHGDKFPQPC